MISRSSSFAAPYQTILGFPNRLSTISTVHTCNENENNFKKPEVEDLESLRFRSEVTIVRVSDQGLVVVKKTGEAI